jgi:hypothetical protein
MWKNMSLPVLVPMNPNPLLFSRLIVPSANASHPSEHRDGFRSG